MTATLYFKRQPTDFPLSTMRKSLGCSGRANPEACRANPEQILRHIEQILRHIEQILRMEPKWEIKSAILSTLNSISILFQTNIILKTSEVLIMLLNHNI